MYSFVKIFRRPPWIIGLHGGSSVAPRLLEELSYEAYAPHGVALFIEAATNNTTRTVANVRMILSKNGGSLASSGALDYVFTRRGVFRIAPPKGDLDEFELELIDHGLIDMFEAEDSDLLLYTEFTHFGDMQSALEKGKNSFIEI